MFELIPQIIIIVSIAGIIVLVARKMPQISSLPEEKKTLDMNGTNQRFKVPGILNRAKAKIKSFKRSKFLHDSLDFFEKILRKIKVVFLKIENKISELAEKVKQQSQKVKEKRKGIEISVNHKIQDNEDNEVKFTNVQKQDNKDGSKDNWEDIENKYIEVISNNPKDIIAYKKLGKLYQEHGNIEDAKEVYKQILKINPDDEEASAYLAQLAEQQFCKL